MNESVSVCFESHRLLHSLALTLQLTHFFNLDISAHLICGGDAAGSFFVWYSTILAVKIRAHRSYVSQIVEAGLFYTL